MSCSSVSMELVSVPRMLSWNGHQHWVDRQSTENPSVVMKSHTYDCKISEDFRKIPTVTQIKFIWQAKECWPLLRRIYCALGKMFIVNTSTEQRMLCFPIYSFIFVCLLVCLLATWRWNAWTDFHAFCSNSNGKMVYSIKYIWYIYT